MMKIYIYDHGWMEVRIRNNDLWLHPLPEDEKANLLDKIAKGEVSVKQTTIIRQGH